MVRITKGKGKKDRVVPMGKHAVRFLREYITKVRPHFTKKNRTVRRLFIDAFGKPLSKQMAGISVRTYGKAANIGKTVSAHTFRHTFASSLVKNGADIRAVQKMMGHADLSTTGIYLRTAGVDVKKAHKMSHPREKEKEEKSIGKPVMERIRPPYASKPRHKQLES
jgi:integrase/recombinase XerD